MCGGGGGGSSSSSSTGMVCNLGNLQDQSIVASPLPPTSALSTTVHTSHSPSAELQRDAASVPTMPKIKTENPDKRMNATPLPLNNVRRLLFSHRKWRRYQPVVVPQVEGRGKHDQQQPARPRERATTCAGSSWGAACLRGVHAPAGGDGKQSSLEQLRCGRGV
jgi:hypothetical protein